MVAMVTSNLNDKDYTKLFPNKFWEKSSRYGGFSLLIEKVINVQSPFGQNPSPSPGLNRVN